MSVHEQERLSAYIDGELGDAERAAVETHLGACPECRARLAELETLDEVARTLPVEAPPGYFESFASRVRARVESEGAPRRRAWRAPSPGPWPAWTWAVAAALLLAVVTPLTLRQTRPTPVPMAQAPREVPVPAPAAAPPEARTGGPSADEQPVGGLPAGLAGEGRQRPAEPAVAPESRESPHSDEAPKTEVPRVRPNEATRAREGSFAVTPQVEDDRPQEKEKAAETFAAAPPPMGRAAEEAPAAAEVGLGKSRADIVSSRAGAASEPEVAAAAPTVEGPVQSIPAKPDVARPGRGEPEAQLALPRDESAYRRLLLGPPTDAEGWRHRREAWRDFVEEHAGSPYADEARVRVIEAGVAAWRAGGRAEDLARARADLALYLSRTDAQQTDRARRALASVEPLQ